MRSSIAHITPYRNLPVLRVLRQEHSTASSPCCLKLLPISSRIISPPAMICRSRLFATKRTMGTKRPARKPTMLSRFSFKSRERFLKHSPFPCMNGRDLRRTIFSAPLRTNYLPTAAPQKMGRMWMSSSPRAIWTRYNSLMMSASASIP